MNAVEILNLFCTQKYKYIGMCMPLKNYTRYVGRESLPEPYLCGYLLFMHHS